jgi:uncharacterized membrane protein YphA (DoxX/SURF4 family)
MSPAPVTKCCSFCRVVEWTARLLVAALFAYTGATKINDLDTFVKEVRAYQLIPLSTSNVLAYTLPWLEVGTAVLLVMGLWRGAARTLLIAMLIVFTAAKSYVLGMGRTLECGCVPTGSMLHFLFNGWIGVLTNVVLLLLLATEGSLAWRRRKLLLAPDSAEQPPAAACTQT